MRLLLIPAILYLAALAPTVARADDPGACYAVRDADRRTLCLAKARGEPSMCYAIRQPVLRAECLAEVRP